MRFIKANLYCMSFNGIRKTWLYENQRKPKFMSVIYIGESNRIRTLIEYGHYPYLRNHKSHTKNV